MYSELFREPRDEQGFIQGENVDLVTPPHIIYAT